MPWLPHLQPRIDAVERTIWSAVWRAYGGGIASWGFLEAMRWRMMGSMPSEPRYFVGVDLGQSRDPTAIAVVRRVDPPRPVPEDQKPKPNYAPGSVEWEEEQQRCRKNEAALCSSLPTGEKAKGQLVAGRVGAVRQEPVGLTAVISPRRPGRLGFQNQVQKTAKSWCGRRRDTHARQARAVFYK